jgi:hypothetical protein
MSAMERSVENFVPVMLPSATPGFLGGGYGFKKRSKSEIRRLYSKKLASPQRQSKLSEEEQLTALKQVFNAGQVKTSRSLIKRASFQEDFLRFDIAA